MKELNDTLAGFVDPGDYLTLVLGADDASTAFIV